MDNRIIHIITEHIIQILLTPMFAHVTGGDNQKNNLQKPEV